MREDEGFGLTIYKHMGMGVGAKDSKPVTEGAEEIETNRESKTDSTRPEERSKKWA